MTEIYLEKLTLGNLIPALFWRFKGHEVRYFELGRLFRKLPAINLVWRNRIFQAEYHVAKPVGLAYHIHSAAITASKIIYDQLILRDATPLKKVCESFHSEKVHAYVKKSLAMEAWPLCRDYLLLKERSVNHHYPLRLVVQDTPLNRLLVPFLIRQEPNPKMVVTGISRTTWRTIQDPFTVLARTAERLINLSLTFLRHGVTLRHRRVRFKMAKELIWGIGVNTGRRNDDFMIDGQKLHPSDILMYYRRSAAARMGNPKYLKESIDNCAQRGYQCVDLDRIPIPLIWGIKHIFPRHVIFPIRISIAAALKSLYLLESPLMYQILDSFISQAMRWEVALGSYYPALNLSQDDPYPSHIADTVAMNRHGTMNGGFQWSDMTTYHSVTLAYLSYNFYFSWGSFSSDFWQDDWTIDQITITGYLWGHLYIDSLSNRDALKAIVLRGKPDNRLVVSLFDEKPDPDVYQSEQMLYDFYSIGTKLLDKIENLIVVVKPKRFNGISPVPQVLDLVSPYIQSGRMIIWDRLEVDLWQILAVSDAAISMVMGTPHLEAICCGRPGFSYAPTQNESSPVYSQGLGTVVFNTVESSVDAVRDTLENREQNPWNHLPQLVEAIDPFGDFQGIDRMRDSILSLTETNMSNLHN